MLVAGLPGSNPMSTGVQTRSHPHVPVGTMGRKKDELPCPWVSHQGPDSGALFSPCLSGLAESLSARTRVAQDTGLGRPWGQPGGLDWLAGHTHQHAWQKPISSTCSVKTHFHRQERARKQAEMGARPAETPTVPLPGYGWQQRTRQPTDSSAQVSAELQAHTCARPDGRHVDLGSRETPLK